MKKLYYANSKTIVISQGTTLDGSVIEDGRKRFGEKLIVNKETVNNAALNEVFSDSGSFEFVSYFINEDDISDKDVYVLDRSGKDFNVFTYKEELNSKGFDTKSLKPSFSWEELKKNDDGLVPVIVTDYKTDKILMMAYMNEAAYYNTFKTGLMNYYSRSRRSQWIKGETSGHFQYIKSMKADCDMDTLLASVSQIGVPCHTGKDTCFFNDVLKDDSVQKNPSKILTDLYKVIEDRKVNPKEGSYTNYLFDKGLDKILKKVGEEACEIVIASKNEEPKEIKYEIADFLYHLSVLMVEKNVTWEEVAEELSKR
ncbi:MAG: bifunctional phosphoribosyl-AMP cyclohydrolase/phosphoribosyl-ATP diphosphatase HisIE [Lachnospiraceae bacterium]|nr:bifunctional phosphoribosyl-AMP cyclohydrolase/phosphoribosyl-ATP diphosphatase HisIE [Lachnospiraceae bacterium]